MANSSQFEAFKQTLKKVFMLDQADLDFGIYRIMNQKRDDIEKYLNESLKSQIDDILDKNKSTQVTEWEKELREAEKAAETLGMSPNDSSKVKELRKKVSSSGNQEDLENEVYSHLATFFSRYYDSGDFISQRRYKKDVYAIPYEGEEVKLYWANADQYYIKTGEYFRTYRFKLDSGKCVEFTLKDATTEQNNNKAQNNMERRFALYKDNNSVETLSDGLHINFTYELYPKKTKQKTLIEDAYSQIKDKLPKEYKSELLVPRPTESDRTRTLLKKHLNDYVARNTFDYFIHKDLKGFLSRELDFYIKNEILEIDDIDSRSPESFTAHLTVIKAIKCIGAKLIDFLSSLENFQKRLWLKKKMVVSADYCITLDRVPESLYPEICSNDAQREEWIKLFAIDKIEEKEVSGVFTQESTSGYTVPLTEQFLKENPYLVLDTAFYSESFKRKLISSLDDLDEQCNGLIINSDNFQTLNLLQTKYAKKVNAIYIDPPYNTVHSEILYKNQFKHSSWLSLINNTLPLVNTFFNEKESSFGLAIDDFEYTNLSMLLSCTYPQLEKSTIVVNHHPQGAGGRISRTHEYYIIMSDSKMPPYLGEPIDDHLENRAFMRSGTSDNNYRHGRWKSFYALLYNPISRTIVGAEAPIPLDETYPTTDTPEGYRRIYPINTRGEERVWRSSYKTGQNRAENGELRLSENGTVYQTIDHIDDRKVLFSNWTDSIFNAGTNGTNILKNMNIDFDYPKSIGTIETGLWAQTFGNTKALILDYFAGSGTTGHAVINMNRKYGGHRKFILADMGAYFHTTLKPRLEKAIYSETWSSGNPVRDRGISFCMKYMQLEQYEDTLNNLVIKNNPLLENSGEFYDGFMLGYLLDTETKDSLFSLDWFVDPWNTKLKITQNNEIKEKKINLIETFNYLIGLNVQKITYPKEDICVVEGYNPKEEHVLIIWRNCNNVSNSDLDDFFNRMAYSTRDQEFDKIYVNGDNNLENLKTADDAWKVTLIEQEFSKKMFELD